MAEPKQPLLAPAAAASEYPLDEKHSLEDITPRRSGDSATQPLIHDSRRRRPRLRHLLQHVRNRSTVLLARCAHNKTLKTLWATLLALLALVLALGVFLHYHPEETPQTSIPHGAPCSLVSAAHLDRIRTLTKPSIHVFHAGEPLTEESIVPLEASLCVLNAVPQKRLLEYQQAPVPGAGPDSIHLYINSSTVRMTNTVPRPLPGQGEQELYTPNAVVYYNEVVMRHAGTYEVHADIEFSNWEWAKQWNDDDDRLVVHYPTGLELPYPDPQARRIAEFLYRPRPDPVVVSHKHKFPQNFQVGRGKARYRPACSDRVSAARGRWLAAAAYDVPGGFVDEWGFAWDGDECRLQYFTDVDAMDCLANKTIHVYGDSNSRRISKAIVSGGHFCHNLTQACQKDESYEAIMKLVEDTQSGGLMDVLDTKNPQWKLPADNLLELDFGYSSKLYFGFQRCITTNWMDWTRKLFDRTYWSQLALDTDHPSEEYMPPFELGRDLHKDARPRMPPGVKSPDLVLLSFGTWDETYLPYMEEFERVLPFYRDYMLEAYPNSMFAIRLNHQICCQQQENDHGRYTMARIQHFNDMTRRVFQVNEAGTYGMGGRVVVVNPEMLVGVPDEVRDYNDMFSTHMRYSKVRTETQMLFNSICVRDERTGRARWRWNI